MTYFRCKPWLTPQQQRVTTPAPSSETIPSSAGSHPTQALLLRLKERTMKMQLSSQSQRGRDPLHLHAKHIPCVGSELRLDPELGLAIGTSKTLVPPAQS